MAAEASSAGSRHFKAHRFGLTGIDQLSRVVGNMDMRDAERCQCIEDRVDVGLRRGPACRVSGARTITCWRVGYWAVGSQWLNRESRMGFMARPHQWRGAREALALAKIDRDRVADFDCGVVHRHGDDELVVTRVSPSHYLNQDLGTVWLDK